MLGLQKCLRSSTVEVLHFWTVGVTMRELTAQPQKRLGGGGRDIGTTIIQPREGLRAAKANNRVRLKEDDEFESKKRHWQENLSCRNTVCTRSKDNLDSKIKETIRRNVVAAVRAVCTPGSRSEDGFRPVAASGAFSGWVPVQHGLCAASQPFHPTHIRPPQVSSPIIGD